MMELGFSTKFLLPAADLILKPPLLAANTAGYPVASPVCLSPVGNLILPLGCLNFCITLAGLVYSVILEL
jgi:hypothetical protein